MGDFTLNVEQKPMDFNRWQLGLDFKKKIFRIADHNASDLQGILDSLARKTLS